MRQARAWVLVTLIVGPALCLCACGKAAPVSAPSVSATFPICTAAGDQMEPAISGSTVVWADTRNGHRTDIYGYDLASHTEFPVCTAAGDQKDPAVAGHVVVWADHRHGTDGWDIYGYDLATHSEFPICTAAGNQQRPAISGDTVVWMDKRNGNQDIYGYDLGGHRRSSPSAQPPGDQSFPSISGDTVVWQDTRHHTWDIYGYDLATKTESPICTTPGGWPLRPAISGSTVVWQDTRNHGLDIYGCDLTDKKVFAVCTWGYTDQYPRISGNTVVWQSGNGPFTIPNAGTFGYDLADHVQFPICTAAGDQHEPAISGDTVVWTDAADNIVGVTLRGASAKAPSSTSSPASSTTPVSYRSVPPPTTPSAGTTDSSGEPANDIRRLVDPLGHFGLALLASEATAHPTGNIVLSPASISDALTMTLNGARGTTATEMQHALGLDGIDLQSADQAWADLITYVGQKKDAQIRVANSLWLKQGYPFLPAFLQTDHDYFAADATPLPANLEQAVKTINAWVDERTGGRIPALLDQLDPSTKAVVVNTIYVKAGWFSPRQFDKTDTRSEPFTLPDGTQADVPMMHGQFAAEVAQTPEYDAVPIPANGQVDVTVVVPKGDQTPESVVPLLEKRGLDSLEEHVTYANVQLALPRFKARFSDSLGPALQGLGMTRAFSPDQADFSGMAAAKPLWIGEVVHEAVLDVNEKGMEAAAGTAVIMATGAGPTKSITIRADRPFVVVLSVGDYQPLPLFVAIERDPRDTGG